MFVIPFLLEIRFVTYYGCERLKTGTNGINTVIMDATKRDASSAKHYDEYQE